MELLSPHTHLPGSAAAARRETPVQRGARLMAQARTEVTVEFALLDARLGGLGASVRDRGAYAFHVLLEIAEIARCITLRLFAGTWVDPRTGATQLTDVWMRRAKAWISALVDTPDCGVPTEALFGSATERAEMHARWDGALSLDHGHSKDRTPEGANVAMLQFERIEAEAMWLSGGVARRIGCMTAQQAWRTGRARVLAMLPTCNVWPPRGYTPSEDLTDSIGTPSHGATDAVDDDDDATSSGSSNSSSSSGEYEHVDVPRKHVNFANPIAVYDSDSAEVDLDETDSSSSADVMASSDSDEAAPVNPSDDEDSDMTDDSSNNNTARPAPPPPRRVARQEVIDLTDD